MREQFGVPKSTEHIYINEMGKALSNISSNYIKFPCESEYNFLLDGFNNISDVRGAILAIDGTKIIIQKPKIESFRYYNRHQTFSITFVCVVDHLMRFRGITYGYGSSHDSFIYRTSNLRRLVEAINDENIYIVGDPAFIGFRNIKSTYNTRANLLSPEMEYNLCKQRIIVENSFAFFKNK